MIEKKTSILTIDGYFKRFYWHLQNGCKHHIDAYRKVEDELREMDAPHQYIDYNSFRKNKHYHLIIKGRLK